MSMLTKEGLSISYMMFMFYFATCVIEEYTSLFLQQVGYTTRSIGFISITGIFTQTVGVTLISYFADKYRCRKLLLFLAILSSVISCVVFDLLPIPDVNCESITKLFGSNQLESTHLRNFTGTVPNANTSSTLTNKTTLSNTSTVSYDPTKKIVENTSSYWLIYILLFTSIRGVFDLTKRLCVGFLNVAVFTHLEQERSKAGYYTSWAWVGTASALFFIGIVLYYVKHSVCGYVLPNYSIVFIHAAICLILSLAPLSWIRFKYSEKKVIDYDEVKRVLYKPHYILILIISLHCGICSVYLTRWEFWYIDHVGGSTIAMAISGLIRRLLIVVACLASPQIIQRCGELNVMNIVLLIASISFLSLAFFPNVWLVIFVDTVMSMALNIGYVSGIIHFSLASTHASSAFFQGIYTLVRAGVGKELGSVIIGVLFTEYGTVITFGGISLASLMFFIIFTIYLRFIYEDHDYTRITIDDEED